MIVSKTVEMIGLPATVFGYEEDEYYRNAGTHAANNPMLFRALASLPADGIVIDGGANIGLTAICAARLAPQARQLVAVEPSPRALACLRQAVASNGLTDRVTIVPKALSSAGGSLRFAEHAFLAGSHLIDGETRFESEVVVPVTTIDALAAELDLPRIDLIKLDLEGHELDALKGAQKVTERFRPTFVMEFNSFATCAYRRQSPILLLEFILEHFGSFQYLHDGAPRIVSTHPEAIDFMYRNMAFSTVDDILFGSAEYRPPPVQRTGFLSRLRRGFQGRNL
jgi:FkbM family methyltransferase